MGGVKRPRELNSDDETESNTAWPRFLVISGRLEEVSAIKICKDLRNLVPGELRNMRRLREGDLLVETENKRQTHALLDIRMLGGVNVKVEPHRTLNRVKGIVTSSEARRCEQDELEDWLSEQGVVECRQLGKGEDVQTLLLTFEKQTLPKTVSIGFELCRVREYIPDPMRCFKCQRYGHLSSKCSRAEVCAICGSCDHTSSREDPCKEEPKCVNCGQDHPAFVRKCPVWVTEKEIQRVKVTMNVNYIKAKNIVSQTVQKQVTYAAVAGIEARPSPAIRNRRNVVQTEEKEVMIVQAVDSKESNDRENELSQNPVDVQEVPVEEMELKSDSGKEGSGDELASENEADMPNEHLEGGSVCSETIEDKLRKRHESVIDYLSRYDLSIAEKVKRVLLELSLTKAGDIFEQRYILGMNHTELEQNKDAAGIEAKELLISKKYDEQQLTVIYSLLRVRMTGIAVQLARRWKKD